MTDMPRLQAGGPLREDALYVARSADIALMEALEAGEFCYVLAPRQMGKSSLMAHARARLQQSGVTVAVVDLTVLGSTGVTVEQWYASLIRSIAQQWGLAEAVTDFLKASQNLTPIYAWTRFLREVALQRMPGRLMLFLDEIDATRRLPFATDEFFASIRALYSERVLDTAFERLCVSLLGVATPQDLIKDDKLTPFNVGRFILLEDFTRAECAAFESVLSRITSQPALLMDAVYAWTNGHPYMTQRLAQEMMYEYEGGTGPEPGRSQVDALVKTLFLERGRQEDSNLSNVDKFFTAYRGQRMAQAMLQLYGRLIGGEAVHAAVENDIQWELRLLGIVSERREEQASVIQARNRIYATVFDAAWVREELKGDWLALLVARWVESGRSEDVVLRGVPLAEMEERLQGRSDATPEEAAFLEASRAVARREEAARQAAELEIERRQRAEERSRSLRQTVTGISALLGIAALLAATAFVLYLRVGSALRSESAAKKIAIDARNDAVVAKNDAVAAKQRADDSFHKEQIATITANKALEQAKMALASEKDARGKEAAANKAKDAALEEVTSSLQKQKALTRIAQKAQHQEAVAKNKAQEARKALAAKLILSGELYDKKLELLAKVQQQVEDLEAESKAKENALALAGKEKARANLEAANAIKAAGDAKTAAADAEKAKTEAFNKAMALEVSQKALLATQEDLKATLAQVKSAAYVERGNRAAQLAAVPGSQFEALLEGISAVESAQKDHLEVPPEATLGLRVALDTFQAGLPLQAHQASVLACAFTYDDHVATAGADQTEWVWNRDNARRSGAPIPISGINNFMARFSSGDVANSKGFIAALKDPNNKPAAWLGQNAPEIQKLLATLPADMDTPPKSKGAGVAPFVLVADALNSLLHSRNLADTEFLPLIENKSPELKSLLKRQLVSDEDQILLNRFLLQDAFPSLVKVGRPNVRLAAYSPDGSKRATVGPLGFDQSVFCAPADEMPIPSDACKVSAVVTAIALSFNNDTWMLAAACSDHKIVLFDLISHTRIKTLAGVDKSVRALSFSPDSRMLLVGCSDGKAILFDLAHSHRKSLNYSAPVVSVAITTQKATQKMGKDDQGQIQYRVAVGYADGMVGRSVIYLKTVNSGIFEQRDIPGAKPLDWLNLLNSHLEVSALAFSADGGYLSVGGADGSVRVWNWDQAIESKPYKTLLGHTGYITSLAWPLSGNGYLLSASSDKTARVWNLKPTSLPDDLTPQQLLDKAQLLRANQPKTADKSRN